MPQQNLVLIRGGGDLATGVAQKFYRAGLRVLVLESPRPTAIRRTVALSQAVYNGHTQVEDIPCRHIASVSGMDACHAAGAVPLLVDPDGNCIQNLRPTAVIDAILAKYNVGTGRHMAPITVGLGPGFTAGQDVDAVIETMRGHNLGRLILRGSALPNTGIPGEIGGQSRQRVLHTPVQGVLQQLCQIGDIVTEGTPVFSVNGNVVTAPFTGLVRGLIQQGLTLPAGTKAADIDPRTNIDVNTISDKARCLGGAALEAYYFLLRRHSQ
ncbi:EF2563 family selenium-dependent molybdenum hydroxylase system protein [Ruminococcaceae bacterium OttesenSCG-928-A16]|nr:EF2563 family selenium-dependent molybdenum hydroxylase system protein [Ruminococcaceae bacterium OttesenSCG-928-A16]